MRCLSVGCIIEWTKSEAILSLLVAVVLVPDIISPSKQSSEFDGYFLICNPDIIFDKQSLNKLVSFCVGKMNIILYPQNHL